MNLPILLILFASLSHGLLFGLPPTASASAVTRALGDAGKALDVADQGVRDLTGRLKALRRSKQPEFDLATAKKIRNRLSRYTAQPKEMPAGKELLAHHPVDGYLHHPSLENWIRAKREVQTILMAVLYTLRDVKGVRSDFVQEPVLQDLSNLFEGPNSVQDQFSLLVHPSTDEESAAMKAMRKKYWALRRDLAQANTVLANYVQHLPQTSKP